MGEFEKRKIRYLNDPHQWLIRYEDLEEAKSEFPKGNLSYKILEIEEWFVKWFGENHQR